ncbi:hypothetical protein VKT23_014367 [Stygiomarasmius scandens]|uniref:WD40 repeat-like protein n=1 Tax=Marasmiellus scandens TaxID=2682957 RepID=A0ABR1J0I1_9AGAR
MQVIDSNSIPKTSEQGRYMLQTFLHGHSGPVACVSAHPLGTHVACGGHNGTMIWHLLTRRLLDSPTGAGDRGTTTAISWITRPDDTDDGLAYGTEDGYLCIWKRCRGEDNFTEVFCDRLNGGTLGQEISAMSYDASSSQLAIVHRAEVVHRFTVDRAMHPTAVKSVTISRHWPQAVAFGQTGIRGREIWSFGREDGEIHVLDDEGKILRTRPTGTVIGHAFISLKDDAVILDDVTQGVALYKLSTPDRVKTFAVPCDERRSRSVSFHDDGSKIVCGSDHGNIYIFDRRTGLVHDIIFIGTKDWVQSVTTVEIAGVPTIIACRSGANVGQDNIQVWEKMTTPISGEQSAKQTTTRDKLRWWIGMILSALFILENVLS